MVENSTVVPAIFSVYFWNNSVLLLLLPYLRWKLHWVRQKSLETRSRVQGFRTSPGIVAEYPYFKKYFLYQLMQISRSSQNHFRLRLQENYDLLSCFLDFFYIKNKLWYSISFFCLLFWACVLEKDYLFKKK